MFFLAGRARCLWWALLLALPMTAQAQSFQTAAQLALLYDPRISAATAAAEAAETRIDQARTARRPQVRFSLNADDADAATQVATLDLSQQLFDFGQTGASVDTATARANLAWIQVAQSVQDVFADTGLAYAGVLEADEQVALQLAFRDEVTGRAAATQDRIAAGLASITELYALNRVQAEAEIALLRAQQDAKAARMELERLTGTLFEGVDPDALVAYFALLPASDAQARALAEQNAPESWLSQQEVRITEAQTAEENRANLPILEAYTNYEYGENDGADVDGGETGVRFSLPLYQGGLADAIAAEGDQSLQQALRTRQQSRQLLAQTATQTWDNVDLAERVEQIWQQTEALQQDRVQAVQNELDAELATVEDLLTASQELNDTRIALIGAKYDVVRARVQLLRTVGLASPVAD